MSEDQPKKRRKPTHKIDTLPYLIILTLALSCAWLLARQPEHITILPKCECPVTSTATYKRKRTRNYNLVTPLRFNY